MKSKNTFLSFLRHALTTVGGALSMSPEPQTKTIGVILVALGGLWGMRDEFKAENPGGGLPIPPAGGTAAMLLLCALLGMGFGIVGCTTPTPGKPDSTAAVLNLAGTSIAPVLKNNPAYIPVAEAVQEGLSSLTTGSIDAVSISKWVASIGAEKKWDAGQIAYAQTMATSAWSIFTSYSGQSSALISDPTVQTWITAFRTGLANAILIAKTPS